MIDVTKQKFIICKNHNRMPNQREYLVSFNKIDYIVDEDFSTLNDVSNAYKFETYSAAKKALDAILDINAEILILDCTINTRQVSDDERLESLYDSGVSKLTEEEYDAIADRIQLQFIHQQLTEN